MVGNIPDTLSNLSKLKVLRINNLLGRVIGTIPEKVI